MIPLLLTLAGLSPGARAAAPELFGMGPENMSMGSASTALADDPYAAYYNPAGLTQLKQVTLSVAPVIGQANLWDFQGIVYDTDGDGRTTDSQGYPDYGAVGTDYRPDGANGQSSFYTEGISLGLALPFRKYAALGIAAYVPTASLLQVQIADPYMPYYVLFQNMNNRFSISPGLALQPVRGVHLGVGAQVMADLTVKGRLSATVDAGAFANDNGGSEVRASANAGVQELKISAMPTKAINYGVLIDGTFFSRSSDPERIRKLRRHAVGLAYRSPWRAKTSANIVATTNGQIQFDDQTILLSDLTKDPVSIELNNLIGFYTPAAMSIGFRTGFGDAHGDAWSEGELARLMITGDAVWTEWSKFVEMVTPAQAVSIESLEGTTVTINVGDDYGKPGFHDTWTLRGGLRYTVGPLHTGNALGGLKIHIRAGAEYVPTPVPAQTGRTNYVDNDRYVAAGGFGFETARLAPFKRWAPLANGPVRLDVGAQYHYLLPRTYIKSDDLLADADGDGYIEYPRGYPLGGKLASGGNVWVATAGLQIQFGNTSPAVRGIREKGYGPKQIGPDEIVAPVEEAPPVESAAPVESGEPVESAAPIAPVEQPAPTMDARLVPDTQVIEATPVKDPVPPESGSVTVGEDFSLKPADDSATAPAEGADEDPSVEELPEEIEDLDAPAHPDKKKDKKKKKEDKKGKSKAEESP